jgi:hypothetical protein
VEGPGIEPRSTDPAPGFDDRLPHDAAHFIVESELGIMGGVFGQLAIGGSANTFFPADTKRQRKSKRRGAKIASANKNDLLFSEHAIYAAQSRWEKQAIIPETKIAPTDIDRIIARFEEFAAVWSTLPVRGSIRLEWGQRRSAKRKR